VSDVEQRWTDRLHLRRPTEEDVAALVAFEVASHDGALTEQAATEQVRGYLAQWSGDGLGYWVVEHHGRLVGVAGLRFMTFHLRDAWNLAYRFERSTWGRGYALEAVQEALVVALEHSARMPVVARTRPGDTHAARLADRAGLERRKDLDRDGLETRVTHW
jgi:ribosomal-protein-alanine N-acetyltransferase